MALHIPRPPLHHNSNASKYLFSAKTLSQLHNQVHVKLSRKGGVGITCRARRRVRHAEEGDQEYGNNSEIAMLEAYSQRQREEALLVNATVDGQEELVLIFKGFSSCLTATTMADPSRSVLPERAVIQSIDVVKGPFDPTNIQYLEKGLTWDTFKPRLQ